MSEEKPSYLTLQPSMRPAAAVRLLEIKARNEGKEYKGSSLEEIMEATEKLGEKISEGELKKRIEEADAWDFFRYVPDLEGKRRLYSFDDSIRTKEEFDHILQSAGLIEVEPRKVKLKVEL